MKLSRLIAACAVLALAACEDSKPATEQADAMPADMPAPPVARKQDYVMELHGDVRNDEYYWMRDDSRTDPEILGHLEAENAYADAMMKHTEALQETLFEEMKSRIREEDTSVPVFMNGYWYFTRVEAGQEYQTRVRKPETLDAEEEVFIDTNSLAEGHEYFALGGFAVSPDNRLLAYSTDTVSRRMYKVEVRDLETGQLLPDQIEGTSGSVVWANDNASFYYINKDPQTLLGYQVKRHRLGTDPASDVIVYEETDPTFYTGIGKSRDGSSVFIYHQQTIKSGVSVIDADDPDAMPVPFLPIRDNHEFDIRKDDDVYYIRTNWNADNFRIMKVSASTHADQSTWEDVWAPGDDVFVAGFELFDNHLVISQKKDGANAVLVMNRSSGETRALQFDDPVFAAFPFANPNLDAETVRISYSSLTTPSSVYDYNLEGAGRELKKQDFAGEGYNPADYASERIFVEARDGAQVPVSLVYRKDMFNKDGTNPLYQYGYGSYGATMEPTFRSSFISLMDRGLVVAIAHIRGSQMLGRGWYEDGKMFNKRNTFTDFIDVTRGLVAEGYGARDKVVAMGGSAGGLLMGAVMNMAPGDYLGIAAHVPFVDVVTTMLDESIPLTTGEWDEWGNPANEDSYKYMKSYSPYDNVEAKDYPHTLVTTGLHDSQVQYFEPMKWVARLRERKTDDNRLVFKTNMQAGHGGASGRYKRLYDRAYEYAFLMDLLDIKE